jgi:hypothetical protein
VIDKNKVIDILKKHPQGLKAKYIADLIVGADRKAINQILYSNPNLFACNSYYEWTLISKTTIERKNVATPLNTQYGEKHVDSEVYNDYRNYYVSIQQKLSSYSDNSISLKLYLLNENDYVIKSNTSTILCPFCNKIFSVHSFDCPQCGQTMHNICEKLYLEWNINGHRFYITEKSVDSFPLNEQKRKVYDAIRRFIISSIPSTICRYFNKIMDEVHLNTLVVIYQRSLGIDKIEDEIKEEIEKGKRVAFKQMVRNDFCNNSEAINVAWRYFKKYLEYKAGALKIKSSDFSIALKLSDADTKQIDIKYFDELYRIFREKTEECLTDAYNNDVAVDYRACKKYLIYMSLINKPVGIKHNKDAIFLKVYGDLDLNNDTIYPTVQVSLKDTIEETDYLRDYHKECDHYCEKVYLKIPLLLSTGELIIRTVLGRYCDKCKKYFVLDIEFKKILCEGRIQAQISFSESGEHFNGMELSPESLLRKCGYTVRANANISAEHRQKLLKAIIENKLYTPAKIVAHFRFLISVNNNVTTRDMSAAISKWQEDIQYLQQHYS